MRANVKTISSNPIAQLDKELQAVHSLKMGGKKTGGERKAESRAPWVNSSTRPRKEIITPDARNRRNNKTACHPKNKDKQRQKINKNNYKT